MRLFVLAFALVFAAAPIAAEVCETTCVEHVDHAEGTKGPSHHHHGSTISHQAGAQAATQKVGNNGGILAAAISHDCCYAVAVLSESRTGNHPTTLIAVLSPANTEARSGVASRAALIDRRDRPPDLAPSLSQLRV
jgi:hypothetical protein